VPVEDILGIAIGVPGIIVFTILILRSFVAATIEGKSVGGCYSMR